MIKQLLSRNSNLNTLFSAIDNNKNVSIFNCGEGEQIAILDEISRPKFFVVADKEEGMKYANSFARLSHKTNCCFDIPSLNLASYSSESQQYVAFINNLNNPDYDVHIATPNVAMLPVPKTIFDNSKSITLAIDEELDRDDLIDFLVNIGYVKCDNISSGGQFCCRGEIVDVVLQNDTTGYRVIFDFDTIVKISVLDENYVEAVSTINSLVIADCNLYNPDFDAIRRDFNDKNVQLKQMLDNYCQFNKTYNNLWFLQYNREPIVPLLSLLDMVVVFSDAKKVYDTCIKAIDDFNASLKEGINNNLLLSTHRNLMQLDNIIKYGDNSKIAFQFINNANRLFNPNAVFSFKCTPNIIYGEHYPSLVIDLDNLHKAGFTVVIFVDNNNYNHLINVLTRRIPYNNIKNLFEIRQNEINVINREYNNSFNFYDDKIAVIGSNAIGKHYVIQQDIKQTNTDALAEVELPKENDYVVHKIHGIGKCLGIQTLQLMQGVKKEYIVISYKNDDRLYLPIENIDSITKYIGDDEEPKLNKLGGAEFKKIKDKVKASVKDIAQDLIKIYKARLDAKGYKYPIDDEIQLDFENKFQYQLTQDQQSVLDLIKSEMQEGKLIDRLICGDVGFGKTEVAIRIAFKTILSGKNVAFLCPTTVLSEQHYNTCASRMAPYGINVAVLNRFKTNKEAQDIIDNINNGKINLIIGTHRLLNKNIEFKNLGLLIIDEEQKFGVEHKERLKELKKDINVLTLSATPIPRTLHLSLSGIRDISTIQTPPMTKISTQVSVMEYNELTIKMVIDKEMQRSGQVLIIYNRVDDIDYVANRIANLTGNSYIIDVAHGQMSSNVLEQKIMNLYKGKTQILISTTLIENGVDLPNANTLIVLDSDKLGLSQLYQLKGRVGRGNRDSYAYFMYRGTISDIAYKRLKAISEFTAMGSGFKIAMKDMEIRGTGDIFGSLQHGHFAKVGYALYMSILNSTIQELRGNAVDNSLYTELKIETDLDINIPNSSAFTTNQKMTLYSNIANIKDEIQYNAVVARIKNIYGDVPQSLENLCKFALIKNKLYKYGATRLVVKNNRKMIEFSDNTDIATIKQLLRDNCTLDMSSKTTININNIDTNAVLDYLLTIL